MAVTKKVPVFSESPTYFCLLRSVIFHNTIMQSDTESFKM